MARLKYINRSLRAGLNRPIRWLVMGSCCWLAACAPTTPVHTHRAADDSEYYVQAVPDDIINRRILPDPVGGLGHSNDPQLRVTDIRLTAQYTVLYLTFDHTLAGYGNNAGTEISIDPKAKLLAPDGKSTFAFVKAEGLPLSPDSRKVEANDKVKFVLYFERLAPGIEEFALYEGEDTATLSFWRVSDMHVENSEK
ncbi:hypothetical protein [Fibrella aquatilis]|uniref:Lipoprotein n=1 Tax=Fibrella aquatilis TaxID=2817059 RepID=A0A939G4E7_9BACT|nr:hypothetical protein [Fibrella aquatilis]MBO0930419.1 hypothetical protein [Fibrella aquatilis]